MPQLTNDFVSAKPGTVLEASYTTSLGRTIDLVTTIIIARKSAHLLVINWHRLVLLLSKTVLCRALSCSG